MMGPERKSMIMPEDERRNTAYHEAGHALVARLMPKTDPVHKVTVIPRGRALGVTMQLPEGDRYSLDKERMLSTIAVLFGGRIAEEVFMHQMTTGASNDFERATSIARDMVTRYGMTDELGPMVYAENEGEVFLGRSVTKTTTMSEETMQEGRSRHPSHHRRAVRDREEADRGQPGQDARDGVGAPRMGDDRFRPDRRHHVRQAAAAAEGLGAVSRQAERQRAAGDAGQRAGGCLRAMLASASRDGASAPFFMSGADLADEPVRDRPRAAARDGHRQRHARLVLRRRRGTVDGAGDRPLRADARRRRRHPRHRRRVEPAWRAAGERRGGARPRPAGARSGGRPRRSGLDRHDQGRGHARRARSRRRHRQRHRRVANSGRARPRRRASELRRLPDAHARHAAIDAGRSGLRRRRRARSRRSCASGSTAAQGAGIARERIVVDPGIGFGKTPAQNLELLRAPGGAPDARRADPRRLVAQVDAGPPRRAGGEGAGRPVAAEQARLEAASVVAAVLAVERGARIVRVHDVAATVAGLAVWQAAHDADNRADLSSAPASTS